MYSWVVPLFLLFISCLVCPTSCLYATDAKQYDIIGVTLHNDIASQISAQISKQQREHAILMIELETLKKESPSKKITYLSIQKETEQQENGWQEKEKQEKRQSKNEKNYKYIILPNFTINKTHYINTSFGTLVLKQRDFQDSKDLCMQIPINAPLRSVALLFSNERFYLIGFNNDESEVKSVQNSPLQIKDSDYEISSWRYFLVLGIMFAILVALYVVRLKQNMGTENSSVVIEQVKMLDSKNKIVLMRYGDKRYLIGLNPQCMTLLDTFDCDLRAEDMQDLPKDKKAQNFMQLFSKRR